MSDPDLDADDAALAAMPQAELVRLLNRLYARVGEASMTASAARASTSDELRERIRTVRLRVLTKAGSSPAPPRTRQQPTAAKLSPTRSAGAPPLPSANDSSRRAFIVLVADDQALARRARTTCGARGIVLMWASSSSTLMQLVTSVTPTHVVIEGAADRIDEASVRQLAARGVRVRWCKGTQSTLDVIAEIVDEKGTT